MSDSGTIQWVAAAAVIAALGSPLALPILAPPCSKINPNVISITQNRIKAAMKRGFQTREAEMVLPRMLDDLAS